MIWNWLGRRPLVVDVALVVVALIATIVAATRHAHPAAGVVLGIAGTLPLLRRRQQPIGTLVAVTAVVLVMVSLGIWLVPLQLGLALYTLASICERRVAVAAGAAAILATAAAEAAAGGLGRSDSVTRLVFPVALWLLGDSIGSRRAYVREIEEKADRLEQGREADARRAAAEEQSRIARELHDVVAHALSVIVIQAAAADDVFERDPGRVREPIRAIESAARAALGDLRRVLGVLQPDADFRPQPGLASLDGLVEQVRATGLEVSLRVEGAPRPLPAAVDLSAYRIVQEALTNTLKHSGAGRASVRVRYGDVLGIEVGDDGAGEAAGAAEEGNGLIGMRERAAMLGGTVEAGFRAGGGYLVSARIPTA